MTPDPRAVAAFEALLARTGGALVLIVDQRLRLVRAGAEAALLAERPHAELVGMSLIAAFGSASLDAVAREALTFGRAAVGEAQLGRLGSRSFTVDAVPLGGGGLVISLSDISTIRRVERVRRDFLANISHELRTPLSSIKLLAETISAGAIGDAVTSREFAAQIGREVDQLTQLVDELLDLSMIESGESKLMIEAADPGQLVHATAERIGPVATRRGMTVRELANTADGAGVRAAADPTRLGQALVNLAHNAVKYSRPGGEIRLGWEAGPSTVRFVVADDGIGIGLAHQARVFERFYKVDRSRTRDDTDEGVLTGSAGLGLAIVRHIAEAHGGVAGVESVEGVGSIFWIDVPRTASGAKPRVTRRADRQ